MREWRRRGKLAACLMVKLRFRLGRVTEKPHTARRARKRIGFTCKRASEDKTIAVGPLENKKKKNKGLFTLEPNAHSMRIGIFHI